MDNQDNRPTQATLHIGIIINPMAGVGGRLALKGSDGSDVRDKALQHDTNALQRAGTRLARTLQTAGSTGSRFRFTSATGEMGATLLQSLQLETQTCGETHSGPTSACNTEAAAQCLLDADVDIIVFAGGDGTARDICKIVGDRVPVLGVPAGVKMHSGVFAVSPEAAGELLARLASGGLVALQTAEVRDIDEEAFRRGEVRSRYFGEMFVPSLGEYLQHTKIGGRESPELVATDIGAWLAETLAEGRTYFIGPGSTTAAIMAALGLPNTLLGVDVIRDGELLHTDADEQALLKFLNETSAQITLVVTVIGGQGHLFGRGNQQFSPAVIAKVGREQILIVATKGKISALEGRPFLVDTNDPNLDKRLQGYYTVVTGYDDYVYYRVGGFHASGSPFREN